VNKLHSNRTGLLTTRTVFYTILTGRQGHKSEFYEFFLCPFGMQETGPFRPSDRSAGPHPKPQNNPKSEQALMPGSDAKSAIPRLPFEGKPPEALFGRPDIRTRLGFRGFSLLLLSGRSIHLTACNQLRESKSKPEPCDPLRQAPPEPADPGVNLARPHCSQLLYDVAGARFGP
jgi:hypothetical protein